MFPFPESDDYLDRYADPDPVDCCRHDVPVSIPCQDCAEAADQVQYADLATPFADNH
jgi:hypothetical protein